MVNSRLNLFTAALSGSAGKRLHPTGALLIPKLRSDFAEFLNDGYLDHLSILYLRTCVGFGTGTRNLPRGFSRRLGVRDSPAYSQLASHLRLCGSGFAMSHPLHAYPRTTIAWVPLAYPVPPLVVTVATWYRNINLLSIAYALRPRLRSRLTLSRLALLRNP